MACDTFLYPEYTNQIGSIINVILSIIIMAISLPGNIVTIIVILKTDALRDEATYLLICSMCVADILVSMLAQPLLIATMVIGGRTSCYLDNVFFIFSWGMAMSSALAIITITVDRFIYINYPFRYRSIVTKRRAIIMIIMVWVISTMFALLPLAWYHQLALQSVTLVVLISISASLLFTYSQISRKICSADAAVANPATKHKSQRSSTKAVILIVMSFFVCWYPWVIISFVIAVHNSHSSNQVFDSESYVVGLYWLFLVFGHANSALNVFIYSKKDRVLRSKIYRFLGLKRNVDSCATTGGSGDGGRNVTTAAYPIIWKQANNERLIIVKSIPSQISQLSN